MNEGHGGSSHLRSNTTKKFMMSFKSLRILVLNEAINRPTARMK